MNASGWNLLFPEGSEASRRKVLKSLEKTAQRLPGMVDCLV